MEAQERRPQPKLGTAQRVLTHMGQALEFANGENNVLTTGDTFEPHPILVESLPDVRTLHEWHQTMLAPAWGYSDSAEYYQHESAHGVVGQIRVPTRIVTAKDDPFIPFESFRHPAVVQNRFITLVAPERGGHCAFISRNGGSERFWAESLGVQFCTRHSALISEEQTS